MNVIIGNTNTNTNIYNKIRNISSKNIKIGMMVSNDIQEIIKKKKALEKIKLSQDSKQSSSVLRKMKELEFESLKRSEKFKILNQKKKNKSSNKFFSFDENEEKESLVKKKLNKVVQEEEIKDMNIKEEKFYFNNSLNSYNNENENKKEIHNIDNVFKDENININNDELNISNQNNENTVKKGLKSIYSETKMGEMTKFLYEDSNFFKSASLTYESTQYVEFLYSKIRVEIFLQFLFSVISMLSAFMSYELEYSHKDKNRHQFSLYISMVSTICLIISILFEYLINSELLHLVQKLPIKLWIYNQERLYNLFGNIILFIWHPSPIFSSIEVKFKITNYDLDQIMPFNSILYSITLFKLWFLFKFVLYYSEYTSSRMNRVCLMNKFKVNFSFCIKALMEKTPFHVQFLFFIMSTLYCSICIRIFERDLDPYTNQIFSNFYNCVWYTIITMTTVGFGDFYPDSLLGKLIGILASFIGVILMSISVITVSSLVDFNNQEYNTFLIFEKSTLDSKKHELSVEIMKKYISATICNKKYLKINEDKVKNKKLEVLESFNQYRKNQIEIDSTHPSHFSIDSVIENTHLLEESFKNLEDNQNKITELLDELLIKLSAKHIPEEEYSDSSLSETL